MNSLALGLESPTKKVSVRGGIVLEVDRPNGILRGRASRSIAAMISPRL